MFRQKEFFANGGYMGIFKWDTNLKVRIFGETLNSVLFWMFIPFMAIYFVDIFGEKITGLLMMIPPVLGVFANLYGGYAADKYGRKRMMVISLIVRVFLLVIFAFSVTPWMNFFSFVGLTVMGNLYHPASMAMVADLVPIEERKMVFSYFYTSVNIGVVLGPIIGAFFFFHYRTYLILTSAATSFILFMVMVKVLRETLPSSSEENRKKLNIVQQIKNYGVIFTDKIFFMYIVAGILISQVFMQMDLYLATYLKTYGTDQILNLGFAEILVTGERLFGYLISENGLLVVLFGVIIARATRNWSDKKALMLSSILFGLSFWLMSFTTNQWLLYGLMGLFTLAELIRTPVIQNFITKIAPEDKRGQYLGASSLQFSIGRTIAPLSVTLSAFVQPFIVFSVIFVSSLLSAYLYKKMFELSSKDLTENQ